MITVYLRSSSIGCFEICQHSFFIEYVLGIKSVSNQKADLGSMTHKSLELLARKKLAEQNNKVSFYEEEMNKIFKIWEIDPKSSSDIAFEFYKNKLPHHKWYKTDRDLIFKYTNDVLNYNDGMFSPLKRDIITPEQFFDFEINEPWAKYTYKNPYDGKELKGNLRIRGTIDLVTKVDNNTIEYIDWKTGRRYNWAKDSIKQYKDLCKDSQLLLYFYALSRLYPEYEYINVTIFFVKDGGPFSICYSRKEHTKFALEMLKRKFGAIKNTQVPKRIITDPKKRFSWCKNVCWYGKNKFDGSENTICDDISKEVQQLGLDRVMIKRGNPSTFSTYSGGGRENIEVKPSGG